MIKHRLIALLFFTAVLKSCESDYEKTKARKGTFTESIYASLEIQPEDHYLVYVAKPAIVDKIYVEEGDTVYEGHVLATLVRDNEERNMNTALLDLELAEEKFKGEASALSSIQAEIEAVKKELEIDSMNYFRQKNLWEDQIGSKVELENKKLKYELSMNRFSSLTKKYNQTRMELETNYQVSINRLQSAQSVLNDHTIRALMDGMVYELNKKKGEFISTQEAFANIGKANAFVLEMSVDEVDIPKIEIGQTTIVALDAYPNQIFEARVSKIFPSKDRKNQTFKVEAIFNEAPPTLYPGMSGEANIVISVVENTLSIPREYLTEESTVITENGEVKVETGLINMEEIQILNGLDSNIWITKPVE